MNEDQSKSTEAVLISIWSRMFPNVDIGPTSDFFGSGGDSLAMIDMMMDVGEAIGVDIDPGLIFQSAVLIEFARNIDASRGISSAQVVDEGPQ